MLAAASVLERLRPLGFVPAWAERYRRFSQAYRRARADGLFEFVSVEGAGKRGEAVHATVQLSALRNFVPEKPFPHESRYVEALGRLDLDAESDGHRWLALLPAAASEALASLANGRAAVLLDATARHRELARRVLARVRDHSRETVLEYLETQLDRLADPDRQRTASRLASLDNRVPGLERARRIAILTVLLGEGEPEIDPSLPLRRQGDVWWVTEFVADGLLTEAEAPV